jgi:crotonobetainyl-CoA:carnitine CoA-transferase CaiB-like acyl-CoA transferase
MMAVDVPGAFDGVRVVEAAQGIGGPMAAWLLAEQGADVVKVEPPEGDRQRGTHHFHVINRSKQSVVLDLERQDGREALLRLLHDADLFVHDWQPGRAESLGLDAAALRARNPRLVVGHLPAYGTKGRWAGLPPDEALVQAVSGICDAQYRYDPAPVYVNFTMSGYAQGIVGALTAAATLLAQRRTGAGDAFEVSAVASLFAMETAAWVRTPNVMRLAGQQDPKGPMPTYRLVKASDGWLFVGALTPGFWANLAVAIGLEDCLADERFKAAPLGIADLDHRRELGARVSAAFGHKTRDEWLQILEEADVPRAPVMSREEWAHDPHVAHNGMMIDVADPELGATRQMNVPVLLKRSPGRVKGPAPVLGSGETNWDGARVDAAPPGGDEIAAPLEGIRVIDLSGFIAGASASMMLADLGAAVIKIEPPGGDGWRTSGLAFLGSNRSKRSLCIDLRKDEGRMLLLELIDQADVVHDNFRAGVMDRLGLSWEVIHARNPRCIVSSVTGYGASGPLSHLPGFDPMMQCRGGVMDAQGAPGGEPVYLQLPVCDYGTALTSAFGIIAALYAREQTGLGDRVETSLAASAFTMQAGEFIYYDGRPADPAGGRDLPGRSPVYRVHATADGYVMLACTTADHVRALAAAIGAEDVAVGGWLTAAVDDAAAEEIGAALKTRPTEEWLESLLAAGVPVAPCVRVEQLFDDEHLAANELWWDSDHPQWGQVRQTGELIKWDRLRMTMQRRAPLLGEHTRECLGQFGVGEERVAALVESGVVVQG